MILPLAALLLAPTAALQDTPAPCPAAAPALPPELAGWTTRTPLATGSVLVPGTAADLQLRPVADVAFHIPPGRAPAAGTFGGQFSFHVAKAGTIRVALGAGAWADVVQVSASGSTTLKSAAHGHGPDCSGIRKIVDFKVEPGNYLLAISGSPDATIAAMVTAPR